MLALVLAPLGVSAVTSACSSEAGGDPDTSPIAWVSPSPDAVIEAGDVVELTVKVNDPSAKLVRFALDGNVLATCDASAGANECRHGDLFRATTAFTDPGPHTLVATAPAKGGELTTTLHIDVRARSTEPGPSGTPDGGPQPGPDGGGPGPDGGTVGPVDRGFLDPDLPLHNVFDGVSWAVLKQHIDVESPPTGSTAAVATCMKTFGASIIKYADANHVSRASVVATALTESNCTNPAGSGDGLSSGPMQVTGSTCASVATGYTSAACKAKMHDDPDFSFEIGVKYMGSTYQVNQHKHDPPKIAAAYNAGSIRRSTLNRWHMVVTGNHIERWVGAYNAYREWESLTVVARQSLDIAIGNFPPAIFNGEHVEAPALLPTAASEGQVVFVGDWAKRDGVFVQRRGGIWHAD